MNTLGVMDPVCSSLSTFHPHH